MLAVINMVYRLLWVMMMMIWVSTQDDFFSFTMREQGLCHTVAFAIYIKKYLKAKEELWKLQYFHHAKIYLIFKKHPLKEKPKILQDITTM